MRLCENKCRFVFFINAIQFLATASKFPTQDLLADNALNDNVGSSVQKMKFIVLLRFGLKTFITSGYQPYRNASEFYAKIKKKTKIQKKSYQLYA